MRRIRRQEANDVSNLLETLQVVLLYEDTEREQNRVFGEEIWLKCCFSSGSAAPRVPVSIHKNEAGPLFRHVRVENSEAQRHTGTDKEGDWLSDVFFWLWSRTFYCQKSLQRLSRAFLFIKFITFAQFLWKGVKCNYERNKLHALTFWSGLFCLLFWICNCIFNYCK